MMTTAKLLLHCPDKPGILAEVTDFITVNKGNIIYLDQYVDHVENIFFMRIEWDSAITVWLLDVYKRQILRCWLLNYNGEEQTFWFCKEGTFSMSNISFTLQTRSAFNVQTIVDSVIYRIDKKQVNERCV